MMIASRDIFTILQAHDAPVGEQLAGQVAAIVGQGTWGETLDKTIHFSKKTIKSVVQNQTIGLDENLVKNTLLPEFWLPILEKMRNKTQ